MKVGRVSLAPSNNKNPPKRQAFKNKREIIKTG